MEESVVNVFPNPATSDNINMQLERVEPGPVHVSIVDMNGRPYFEAELTSEEAIGGLHLNVNQTLNNGLYLMVIKDAKKTTKKIIAIKN
jgi:hypothetical protein